MRSMSPIAILMVVLALWAIPVSAKGVFTCESVMEKSEMRYCSDTHDIQTLGVPWETKDWSWEAPRPNTTDDWDNNQENCTVLHIHDQDSNFTIDTSNINMFWKTKIQCIEGNIDMKLSGDIYTGEGFDWLRAVIGDVILKDTSVTRFGISTLEVVDGRIIIMNNPNLLDVDYFLNSSLDKVQTYDFQNVNYNVTIENWSALTTVEGFEIVNNPLLTSLRGFRAIEKISCKTNALRGGLSACLTVVKNPSLVEGFGWHERSAWFNTSLPTSIGSLSVMETDKTWPYYQNHQSRLYLMEDDTTDDLMYGTGWGVPAWRTDVVDENVSAYVNEQHPIIMDICMLSGNAWSYDYGENIQCPSGDVGRKCHEWSVHLPDENEENLYAIQKYAKNSIYRCFEGMCFRYERDDTGYKWIYAENNMGNDYWLAFEKTPMNRTYTTGIYEYTNGPRNYENQTWTVDDIEMTLTEQDGTKKVWKWCCDCEYRNDDKNPVDDEDEDPPDF